MASKQTHRAYTVIKRDPLPDGKPNDFWLNLGPVFAHEDGQGFTILLNALPIDGRIVLRPYKEEDDQPEKGKGHEPEPKPRYQKR